MSGGGVVIAPKHNGGGAVFILTQCPAWPYGLSGSLGDDGAPVSYLYK